MAVVLTLPFLAMLLGSISLTVGCRAATDRESLVTIGPLTLDYLPRRDDAGGEYWDRVPNQPAVDASCGRREYCAPTWKGLLSRVRDICDSQRVSVELFDECDGYRVVLLTGADYRSTLYYDRTGRLTTFEEQKTFSRACFGLPPPVSPTKLTSCAKRAGCS